MTTLVLDKVFTLLDVLANAEDEYMSLAQLSRATSIPKPTLHRLLGDLSEQGVLARDENQYSLGSRLYELGGRVPPFRRLKDAALPEMFELFERCGRTVNLSVMAGPDVLYLHSIRGRHSELHAARYGGKLPAHSTASGKAMLAWSSSARVGRLLSGTLSRRTPRTLVTATPLLAQLDSVRRTGLAFDNEEAFVGYACVACAIRDSAGRAIAAISVSDSAHAMWCSPAQTYLLPAVKAIEEQLGTVRSSV